MPKKNNPPRPTCVAQGQRPTSRGGTKVQGCELLAPAGSMEALRTAIANGCDAVYLGMQRFGARAYSNNFDDAEIAQAVAYAHLRDVKVYVTVNTIVFEDELPAVFQQLDYLNSIGVDGVIVQDLAVLSYVASHFQDMEAHCSTQMGLDDLDGALLAKEMGAKRVVLAREVPIEQVKRIRNEAQIPVEIFIHGALCISYSGNCIMSGMTGNRSGNRGRCIGSCRKLYTIRNLTSGDVLGQNYILSAKDLNTIDFADQLEGVDSLKIEGRMKEPVYVANVVSRYRMALDGTATPDALQKLNRTFNRTFTKGYLFGEDHGQITHVERPNHNGYRIGTIAGKARGMYRIDLDGHLAQNDIIRIQHGAQEVNLAVARIYDEGGRLINGSDSTCFVKVKERLAAGDEVFKTKDVAFERELESLFTGEFRRFPIDFEVHAAPGAPLAIHAQSCGVSCDYASDDVLSEAKSKPASRESVVKQLGKLSDTVFTLGQVDYQDKGAFLPVSMLNDARRSIVQELARLKVESRQGGRRILAPVSAAAQRAERASAQHAAASVAASYEPDASDSASAAAQHEPISFEPQAPILCASVVNREQYQACIEAGIECVWFDNVIARNGCEYADRDGQLLIGGLGGVHRYRESNPFVTDYSLNVVNASSCYELHRLGAKRVTLSYEINEGQLCDLVASYRKANGGDPSLEMIVYGHAPLLVTKYCPLKRMGQCGACRENRYQIEDDRDTFPILSGENCNTTILNGKVLNLLDQMPGIEGVAAFRLNFTIESANEVAQVIAMAKGKLDGTIVDSVFRPKTDTRGYFYKEIL